MDIEEIATLIRDSIRDLPTKHKHNQDEILKLEQEKQDLLHFIEFNNVGTVQSHKIYKDLQDNRQQRRVLKDENELLDPLVETLRKFRNQLSELDRVVGDIRKRKNVHETRTYKCRVREDLQDKMPS